MTTPSAVDEALRGEAEDAHCLGSVSLRRVARLHIDRRVLAAEVRRLQGAEKMARIAQHELQDEVDRCNEELARLRQPAPDAAPQEAHKYDQFDRWCAKEIRRELNQRRRGGQYLLSDDADKWLDSVADTAHQPAPVAALEPPVSDAEVSALEGRLKNPVPVKYVDEILSVARDAIALLRRRTAGAGWKLVPMEPTPEMVSAGLLNTTVAVTECAGALSVKQTYSGVSQCYRAMIAAAPPAAGEKTP